MEIIRGWIDVIRDGGWSGLLMAGFAVVAVMFVFGFIGNKYFWVVIGLILIAFGVWHFDLIGEL